MFIRKIVSCRRLLALLACLVIGMNSAEADEEYAKKADYLVKLSDYVTNWPSSAATLVFCVAGPDPFGNQLDQAANSRKRQDGKKLKVRRLGAGQDFGGCHVLFISRKGNALSAVNKAGKATLTVSDEPKFAENGGMIGFIMEGQHVRFEINEQAVKASGLKLSAKLWGLARKIY
jgi:hypothetical protein